MAYDIIGDIHGHSEKLEALLRRMSYSKTNGCWSHPGRTAIFLGDFIDRGPHQLDSVKTVRRMVDSGAALAVMGNHELNAVAWHTPDPEIPGEYLRPHFSAKWGEKNRKQHERFLAEVEHKPDLHREIIDWFLTLPLWLDLPAIRVVHACWHGRFMDWLRPYLADGNKLGPGLLPEVTREPENETEKDNATPSLFKAAEALTKGIEIPLPPGHSFFDKDGIERRRVRVRWWDAEASSYRDAAMLPKDARRQLATELIPQHARVDLPNDKPIFFGHYWLTGTPDILSPDATCLDYSAGKGGPLVAYRWDGESRLKQKNLVQTD